MIVYGYAKGYYYDEQGSMFVKVRIPSVHGAYRQQDYKGASVKNYVLDEDLPFYQSVVLPRSPSEGDVVALTSTGEGRGSDFLVVGLTGSSYNSGVKNSSKAS